MNVAFDRGKINPTQQDIATFYCGLSVLAGVNKVKVAFDRGKIVPTQQDDMTTFYCGLSVLTSIN